MKYLFGLILLLVTNVSYAIVAVEPERIVGNIKPVCISCNDDNILIAYLGIFIFAGIFGLIAHLLMSWGLYRIAIVHRTGNAWLSWVPVGNIYIMSTLAGKSDAFFIGWVMVSLIFPLAIFGIIFYVLALIEITKKLGHGKGMTVLGVFLPFIAFPIMGSKATRDLAIANRTDGSTPISLII